jgi:hypothetical protein
MKMLTARWENGGVNELWAAEMEPGFYAEWVQYPPAPEMYYITAGEVRFRVYDEEFTAYPECLVKIPKFADHSLQVLSKAVMYDIGGLTRWQALLEDYTSIRTRPRQGEGSGGDGEAEGQVRLSYPILRREIGPWAECAAPAAFFRPDIAIKNMGPNACAHKHTLMSACVNCYLTRSRRTFIIHIE